MSDTSSNHIHRSRLGACWIFGVPGLNCTESAGGTQEALAEVASGTLKTAAALVETVKLWAISLGSDDMEAQVNFNFARSMSCSQEIMGTG